MSEALLVTFWHATGDHGSRLALPYVLCERPGFVMQFHKSPKQISVKEQQVGQFGTQTRNLVSPTLLGKLG